MTDLIKRLFKRPKNLTLTAESVSARGLVRPENQDALFLLNTCGLFCLADGMGGGQGGALASRWVCDEIAAVAARLVSPVERDRRGILDASLQAVNRRIRDYAGQSGYKMMGSTVALFLADPADSSAALLVHAGDSRIYRLRRDTLTQLTQDHTVGNELGVSAHSRSEAAELTSRENPLTHILTRAVGTEYRVRPTWADTDLCRGDRFLLCTDGVHDMVSDATIRTLLGRHARLSDALAALEGEIVRNGAKDNYSMIVIQVS